VHLVWQMFVFSGLTLLLSKLLRSLGKFHVAYLPNDCFVSGGKGKEERKEEKRITSSVTRQGSFYDNRSPRPPAPLSL